ncbi:glycosyltransferase family 2 protein [bacterium]|nr:glycosyltransferase [Candidatus Omnitrophota bacterium]MBU3929189.1 glycosyltransferase family 2 protein [bacterium]MBU4123419.1 glycosyltransferase family 2 protein [bacterium]
MKVTLVVLTLNEVTGMRTIMPRIKREWVDQILILDGGSTDGTIEYARENGYSVYIQKKKGIRNGYMEIYDLIEGDVLITFSPDGNSIPELIPPLIEKMKKGYDMVIVSRYKDGAKSADDDIVTAFGNWMFTSIINICFGVKYTDAMVIYRAYKKELIKKLDLDKDDTYLPEKWFFTKVPWEPILSTKCAKMKLKIGEIPGDEPPRIGGVRKLQIIRWGCVFLTQILREVFFLK